MLNACGCAVLHQHPLRYAATHLPPIASSGSHATVHCLRKSLRSFMPPMDVQKHAVFYVIFAEVRKLTVSYLLLHAGHLRAVGAAAFADGPARVHHGGRALRPG